MRKIAVKNSFVGISTGLLLCFLSIALATYTPFDTSPFYYCSPYISRSSSVHNWMGILGAYISAFLQYWIGGTTAWCSIVLMSILSITRKWNINTLIGTLTLTLSLTAIIAVYASELVSTPVPGGVLGHYLIACIHLQEHRSLGILCIRASILASLLLFEIPMYPLQKKWSRLF